MFNVSYSAVDTLQVVLVQEDIVTDGSLNGMPVELTDITTSNGTHNIHAYLCYLT